MTIEKAIDEFVTAASTMREFMEQPVCDVHALMAASDKKRHSRDRLIRKIGSISDIHRVEITARTLCGKRIVLAPSSKVPARWKTIWFDQQEAPWGEHEHQTLESALEHYLRECDIKKLEIRANQTT